MSADEVAQDVSQVTDFHFHTCRKFRLCLEKTVASPAGLIVRNRLATSSQLGVTFALVGAKQLICFPTKSLLNYKVTRENMNVEVTDLSVKSIDLNGVESINDMGVNSDGTLLAILHTKNNDVSVDVFDIKTLCSEASTPPKPLCTTRVGTEQTNQGSCFEWNPAFPDTFAAASTDRSLMVAKISVQNPLSQKLIGIGKLGAITTAISWSPKGKQLTIGDSLGKIIQLKPELDIVRSQLGPEHNPGYGKVTGLCWLATTEWLVSFERGTDHDAYLMRCKKDKPTEWMQYHELSYSSSKWPFSPLLLPASQLLVDWNIVIIGNSKTSEVATVGKREDWQTWVPVEGEGIYLPTTTNGKDTVPVGITIDRSMTEYVSLKSDGSQNHRPSPLVMCLTNDGVLTAHHVISTFAAHNPCQVPSQNITITGLTKLQFAPHTLPPHANASHALSTQIPTAKPSTIFQQKPNTEPIFSAKSNILGTPTTGPKPAAPLLATASPSSFGSNQPSTPSSGATPAVVASPTASTSQPKMLPPAPVPNSNVDDTKALEMKKAEALSIKKKILVERVSKLNSTMVSTKDSVMKMAFAVGKVKACVLECAEVVQASLGDSREVMEELKNLIQSIERMSDRTQHTVKEMDFEIDEKMELVAGVEDGERVLEKLRNMSETEKMMRFNKLETTGDSLNGKYEECCDKLKKLRVQLVEKESLRKQAVLSPLRHNSNLNQLRSGAETEIALKVMRNVSKIIVDTRDRIQRTELDFVRFKREVSQGTGESKNKTVPISNPSEMSILEGDAPQHGSLTDAEIVKARQALVSRIHKRGPVKTHNVTVESYKKPIEPRAKRTDEIDTSNLSNAILKLSMTPRRVMPSSSIFSTNTTTPSRKADAATQADEPPVVKTVVVTVESPAKPITTAPVVSLPKPVATTFTTSSSTPKVPVVKEEVKEQKPAAPLPTSSIFSGSLFGSKTPNVPVSTVGTSPLPSSGSSSLFGSSLNISPPEQSRTDSKPVVTAEKGNVTIVSEVKEKQDVPKETQAPVKAEPSPSESVKQDEPTPVQIPEVKEEPKIEAPAVNPLVAPSAPIEAKEENTPQTPSFSFSTPKTATTTPSIFGGGLGSQTPSSTNTSSVFGGAGKTAPVAAGSGSSIFGGGAKTTTSPFGSFGQNTSQPAQAQNPAPAASSVSFSFNSGSSAAPAKPVGFGAFGGSTVTKPSSVFGASVTSPTVPNVDDGMEDDSMVNGGGPGGFMSGLGSSGNSNTSNSGNNPFAPKASASSSSNNSWLFGGGASQQQTQQQQKPSFSFNTGTSQQPAASVSTSTSSAFGAAPKFGSQPVFGSKPFGGGAGTSASGLSKNASIFGGAVSSSPNAPAGGGFAQFATGQQTSSLFGGTASPQSSSSIFGGGAKTPAAPTSSIFGGGASTNVNKAPSFTSWR